MREQNSELGYLATPDGGGPGIVLLHDVWGLSDHTRDVARRFSGLGFVTLALDLYRELADARVTDPGPFMRELSDPDLVRLVGDGVESLRASPDVAGRGVSVVGFCMGGTYAIFAGALVPGVAAVAAFYGVLSHRHGLYFAEGGLDPKKKPLEPIEAARRLRAPLIAFYGDADPFVPMTDVEALVRIVDGQPGSEVVVYPGAGHAFANDTRPAAYRPESARDAFERMARFLRAHAGAAAP